MERTLSAPNPNRVSGTQSVLNPNAPVAPIFNSQHTRPAAATVASEPATRCSTPRPKSASQDLEAASRAAMLGKDSRRIIPEESWDNTASGESGDDEKFDGSGLGEEEGEAGDEEDDEEDPGNREVDRANDELLSKVLAEGNWSSTHRGDMRGKQGSGDGAGAAKTGGKSKGSARCRKIRPNWLMNPFRKVLESCRQRNQQGQFRLYSTEGTFWVRGKSAYFILQKQGVRITPEMLYNPTFFVWDCDALSPDGIPCPNCGTKLTRHGAVEDPRIVVGMNEPFWLVGFRYRCRRCSEAKQDGKNVVFRSWDRRIIAKCRPELAAEFPARLSHRSAIENGLFELMRSCFQNGMGSKQFSDLLRTQHLLRYDKQHLQYLEHVYSLQLSEWLGHKFRSFPEFEDRGPAGYQGYVPGGEWLRNMYDLYIEEHGDEIDQYTALLSAQVCALDHSHKVRIQFLEFYH